MHDSNPSLLDLSTIAPLQYCVMLKLLVIHVLEHRNLHLFGSCCAVYVSFKYFGVLEFWGFEVVHCIYVEVVLHFI